MLGGAAGREVVDGLLICTVEPSRDPHPSPDNRMAVVSPSRPRGGRDGENKKAFVGAFEKIKQFHIFSLQHYLFVGVQNSIAKWYCNSQFGP